VLFFSLSWEKNAPFDCRQTKFFLLQPLDSRFKISHWINEISKIMRCWMKSTHELNYWQRVLTFLICTLLISTKRETLYHRVRVSQCHEPYSFLSIYNSWMLSS
jgi:hypothetical protein